MSLTGVIRILLLNLKWSNPAKKKHKDILKGHVDALADLQRVFYASDTYSMLLVFQAMSTATGRPTIWH